MNPSIAIIDTNTLSAMALRGILWDIFPSVDVVTFGRMTDFFADCNRFFVHYFVSDDVMFANAGEFDMLRKEVIVTSRGRCPSLVAAGFKVLDVSLPEAELIREILRLHERGCTSHHGPAAAGHHGLYANDHGTFAQVSTDVLSDREKEVLALIVTYSGPWSASNSSLK